MYSNTYFNRIVGLFETAHRDGDDIAKIRRKLKKITEVAIEGLAFSEFGAAILEGTLRAVLLGVGGQGANVGQVFNEIINLYGDVLAEHARSTPLQIKLIDHFANRCVEPGSPFTPFFGGIIEALNGICLSAEAINNWKATKQQNAGNLSPEMAALVQAVPLVGFMMGPQAAVGGFDEADAMARDMGF